MLDWNKLFNIVFVAVACALIVFFLVSTIVVAAKGKRKCNAFDVILRILAGLAFIASTAAFACAVLIMIGGEFCIIAEQIDGVAAAAFVMGESITELPIPELFVALSTTIGYNLAAVLFICSLAALIVDCVVANKKPDSAAKVKKAKKSETTKSPEQLKREAELLRIRKIGESAVKKTNAAVQAEAKSTEQAKGTATDSFMEQQIEQQADEQPDSDWRHAEPEQKPTEFVGLKDSNDDFDSFDSFDGDGETLDAQEDEQNDEQPQHAEKPAEADQADETFGGTADDLDPEFSYDAEQDNASADGAQDVYDEPERYETFEQDEQFDAEAENEQLETYDDDVPEDEAWYAQGNDVVDDFDAEDDSAEDAYDHAEPSFDDEHIEPDRDIYIPQMRTIVRQAEPPRPVRNRPEKPTAQPEKPVAKQTAARKPRKPGDSAGTKAAKAAQASQKSTGAKTKAATAAQSAKQKAAPRDEKKLPVTRRYVILDRRNAVNMFGEYLKERNQAEKDRLKSSINTIIIE